MVCCRIVQPAMVHGHMSAKQHSSCPSPLDKSRHGRLTAAITHCRGVGVGHEHFGDCVAALAAGMRNPVHEELSLQAVWALQGVGKRLAEASPAVRGSSCSAVVVQDADARMTLPIIAECGMRHAKNA